MRVTSVFVPFNGLTIPKGVSQDALMQFLLQYAQLTTYGKARNTYEAVDVSHFKNGRTECVRPVSEELLAFVGTLLQENHLVKHWMLHWPNTKHALKLANSVKVPIVTCWVSN